MSFLSEWTQWNELTIGSSTAKVATVEPRNSGKFGHPKLLRYCGVFRYFAGSIVKSDDLVIRKLSANAGFSAILQYAIAGFYCI